MGLTRLVNRVGRAWGELGAPRLAPSGKGKQIDGVSFAPICRWFAGRKTRAGGRFPTPTVPVSKGSHKLLLFFF